MNFFTRLILRRAGWMAILGFLLAYAGGYYSIQLYKNLRTDIEELLPTTARSVVDLNQVKDRLESIDNLAVLVFSKNTAASKRFVTDLSRRLEKAPRDTIASVEYNISKELKFFKLRRALYMDLSDLKKVRDYIRDRITYEKTLYNPLTIFSSSNVPEPRLDLMGLQKKYDGKVSAYSRFPEGYYATPDETKRVVLINLPGNASGVAGTHRLKDYVVKTIAELNPASYAEDLDIKYTGGVQNNIEEQSALIADLELSTAVVLVLVSVAMLIFFRAPRAVLALLASLLMGTVWTFGASYFAVGYLNANSAFLGSIVLGNGINFGIIFIARYLEERRNNRDHAFALDQSMTQTATSTWTAALAAGLSYGSLSLTSFRGFTQFGIIGLIGMVLCWLSAFTVLPALLTLLDRMKSLGPKKQYQYSRVAGWFAERVSRNARLISFASLALTVAALATGGRYTPKILQTDLSKLRNKESMEHGSGYLSKYVDEIFNRYLSPMVILPKTREDALKIAEALKKKQTAGGKSSLIASVQTIDDFIPKDQPQKIAVLHEIQKLLPERIFVRLPKEDRERAREFLTPEAMHVINMKDLPGLVLTKFTEKDGSLGKMVLVEPPLTQETLDGNNLIHFIKDLRNAADSVSPGTPVAGSLPISSDMIESITRDGPKATLSAFLAVVILIVLLFRRLNTIVPVLTALLMGVIWLGGIILGFGVKINFLNFIALPITFGIGVDYGVNIFQRYREEGGANILKVIRDTGGAVALCSFTTVTGYASLLIAQNQAFVSFGLLAVLGELTCIVAAIISLPALLLTFSRRKV